MSWSTPANYNRGTGKENVTGLGPDLSPIKMLWQDLRRAVHKQMAENFNELKEQCKDEWDNFNLSQREEVIKSYKKWWPVKMFFPLDSKQKKWLTADSKWDL